MFEIDVEKNVRELLVNTIFAHPDDVKKPVKDSMMTAITKKGKATETVRETAKGR
jgi:hypothetical protein